MRTKNIRRVTLPIILMAVCPAMATAAVPSDNSAEHEVMSGTAVMQRPTSLSAEVAQLADRLGLGDKIRRVAELRSADLHNDHNMIELLSAKQDIIQRVIVALLQVRGAAAQVSFQISEADQLSN